MTRQSELLTVASTRKLKVFKLFIDLLRSKEQMFLINLKVDICQYAPSILLDKSPDFGSSSRINGENMNRCMIRFSIGTVSPPKRCTAHGPPPKCIWPQLSKHKTRLVLYWRSRWWALMWTLLNIKGCDLDRYVGRHRRSAGLDGSHDGRHRSGDGLNWEKMSGTYWC